MRKSLKDRAATLIFKEKGEVFQNDAINEKLSNSINLQASNAFENYGKNRCNGSPIMNKLRRK